MEFTSRITRNLIIIVSEDYTPTIEKTEAYNRIIVTRKIDYHFLTHSGTLLFYRPQNRMDFKKGLNQVIESVGLVNPKFLDVGVDLNKGLSMLWSNRVEVYGQTFLEGNMSYEKIWSGIEEMKRLKRSKPIKRKKSEDEGEGSKPKLGKYDKFKLERVVMWIRLEEHYEAVQALYDFCRKPENVDWLEDRLVGDVRSADRIRYMKILQSEFERKMEKGSDSSDDEGKLVIDMDAE
uniref:ORF96 n=1 Tax=Malaco herpesvirus 1 TaxID=3031797 RepID=A0AA48SFH9_9VIRU|nr:TPA_asm: ORF96 [Malaco herpesvirus 1]